jgi:hypothetical protein
VGTELVGCQRCAFMATCQLVTAEKLMSGHECHKYEEAGDVELDARDSVVQQFGLRALSYSLPSVKRALKRTRVSRRRKKNG